MHHAAPISLSSRREFMQRIAASGAAVMIAPRARWRLSDTRLRVLSIGVVGTIGGTDRQTIASHPEVDMVGLCDIDSAAMAQAVKEHPKAFTCVDYREAFDKYADKFDACIVSTPDHSHCAIMTMALSKGKHVYGQKPLVHQLEELTILENAAKARPKLVTQTGAQRIQSVARRAAVDILKSGKLGKVIESHIMFGNGALAGGFYFADGKLGDPCEPPKGFDYNLWLNGAQEEPCRPNMVQRQWRSWFRFGGGQIADWVVHTTDILFYAFPELTSPTQVCTRTPTREMPFFHADRVTSALTYNVSGDKFAHSTFNLYFYDTNLKPDRAQLGIGEGEWASGVETIVVCEGGTLVLAPEGPLEIWQDGKMTDGTKFDWLPKYESFNHWHAWVDKALGKNTPHHWTPFAVGLRCTEPGILAVKAAKYRGEVLNWNRAKLEFTNNADATKTLVRREYRKGFEPIRLG